MVDTSGGRTGSRFGPYELLALLGRGGMGEVYEARDTVKDRVVALKLLPEALADDAEYQERFRREARTAARLQEPHVIPIHDFGEIDGVLYIDMRLVRGEDLKSILKQQGALGPARSLALVSQVAAALDAAHADGLVHRDIKPENVLVTDDDFAYLADFGIASSEHDTRLTGTGSAIGSIAYMAPERFREEPITPAADVYALGCLLHECLTGQTPYQRRTVSAQIASHLYDPPPMVSREQSGVPAALDSVVAKALAKRPQDRFRAAGELAAAARAALPAHHRDEATTILRSAAAGGAALGGSAAAAAAGTRSTRPAEDIRTAPTAQTPASGYATGSPGGYAGRSGGPGGPGGSGGGYGGPSGGPAGGAAASSGDPGRRQAGVRGAWWVAAAMAAVAALVAGVVLIDRLREAPNEQASQTTAPSSPAQVTTSAPTTSSGGSESAQAAPPTVTVTSPGPSPASPTPQTEEPGGSVDQPRPPTPSAPPAGLSGAGYDRQGWTSVSDARCNADDPAQMVAQSTKSYVVICARADNGVRYYKGYRTTDGSSIEIAKPTPTGGGWFVSNKGYQYHITPSSLRIISDKGAEVANEPMLAYDQT